MSSAISDTELIIYLDDAANLLRKMISVPSFSSEESMCAAIVSAYLKSKGVTVERVKNNIIARLNCSVKQAPVLMLNSHIDTVRPTSDYTFDPFNPPFDKNRVLGLGSNDAGASVVSMIQAFLWFKERGKLDFNLLLIISAQEENSGADGISLALKEAGRVDAAIVGEPTQMKAAVAERGLLVIDGSAKGVSGHAARGEGVNSIYIALEDILKIKEHRFKRISPLMGEVKMTVTQINAGSQHNVVPELCSFVVDIRPTDVYQNSEILDELKQFANCDLKARNLTNRSSATPVGHPLMKTLELCSVESYVSPTTSDWMRLSVPAIKMGPGDSSRSHRADEYITLDELCGGIKGYISFIEKLNLKI
ncbi:MAG: M20/M25/M40 family metallo-hydrolase [Bacteroidales bacterium]|nr:M20/M25/M40 family metallo-hydrolase [Bacteroidales bacterium]